MQRISLDQSIQYTQSPQHENKKRKRPEKDEEDYTVLDSYKELATSTNNNPLQDLSAEKEQDLSGYQLGEWDSYQPGINTHGVKQIRPELTSSGNLNLRGSTLFGKVIQSSHLGKGVYGTVKIIVMNHGDMQSQQAVKITPYMGSKTDVSMKNFHDYVRENRLDSILLVPFAMLCDPLLGTTYQIMPLANFGDGNKLITSLSQLNSHDKELVKRHTMLSLIKAHSVMNEYGIKHLDLKPANIIFDDTGRCYLCDFDLSVILQSNGEYYHKPKYLEWDSAFTPYNLAPSLDLNASNRAVYFSALDAYRLGLTCLLIYCEIGKEEAETLNLREIKPEKLASMLEQANVPFKVRNIITALLRYEISERISIEQVVHLVQDWELDEVQKKQVQNIFSHLSKESSMELSVDKDESIVPAANIFALDKLEKDSDGYCELNCSMEYLLDALEAKNPLSCSQKIMDLMASTYEASAADYNETDYQEKKMKPAQSRKRQKLSKEDPIDSAEASIQPELTIFASDFGLFANQQSSPTDSSATQGRRINPLRITRN